MIFDIMLLTEERKGNIDTARRVLIDECGLVSPKYDRLSAEQDVVVWEDSEGKGRYRVHFYPHIPRGTQFYEGIQFNYWLSKAKMKKEIFESDPMQSAIKIVKNNLRGIVKEEINIEVKTIEEVLNFNMEAF